jgi:hypothetical protein
MDSKREKEMKSKKKTSTNFANIAGTHAEHFNIIIITVGVNDLYSQVSFHSTMDHNLGNISSKLKILHLLLAGLLVERK